MSKLWLKSTPGNTSQSDLKRVQDEKAARETLDIKSTSDTRTTPEVKPAVDTHEPEPATSTAVDIRSTPNTKATPDIKSILPSQWTAVPNDISDHLNGTLELSDQALLARLYRLTWGFHKDTCNVSNVSLGLACNMSSKQVQRSARRLQKRGLIKVVGYDFDNPDKKKRGVIYQMLLPKATVDIKSGVDAKSRAAVRSRADTTSPIKEKALKDISKRALCDLCKHSSGMIHVDPDNPNLGVRRCTHGS